MAISTKEIVVQLFSVLAMILTFLLWIPQIYQNYKMKTTDNFPAALVILWLASAILSTSYYVYTVQSPVLITCWVCFCFFSIIILYQIGLYNKKKAVIILLVAIVVTTGSILGIYYMYKYWKAFQPHINLFNAIVPPILTVVGFLPQFYWIFKSKSTTGIALGMILVDVALCVCAIIALLVNDLKAYVGVIPFVIIGVAELGILVLKLFVFPQSSPEEVVSLQSPTTETPELPNS